MKVTITFMIFLLLAVLSFSQNTALKSEIKIGDTLQGGIVYFVDESGEHGLVAAPVDQTTEMVKWGPNDDIGALSPTDGQGNTNKIIAYYHSHKKEVQTAAHLCDCLELGGYSDWYLPAIDELVLLHTERQAVGNFLVGDYCSSTEMRKADAYSVHFKPNKRVTFFYNKDNKDYFVRCIRKF